MSKLALPTGLGFILGCALIFWREPDGASAAGYIFLSVVAVNVLWGIVRAIGGGQK